MGVQRRDVYRSQCAGAIDTRVSGVNDQGEMVGASFNGTTVTNFLYNNGQFTNIGVEGLGINGLGQIVGDVGGVGICRGWRSLYNVQRTGSYIYSSKGH